MKKKKRAELLELAELVGNATTEVRNQVPCTGTAADGRLYATADDVFLCMKQSLAHRRLVPVCDLLDCKSIDTLDGPMVLYRFRMGFLGWPAGDETRVVAFRSHSEGASTIALKNWLRTKFMLGTGADPATTAVESPKATPLEPPPVVADWDGDRLILEGEASDEHKQQIVFLAVTRRLGDKSLTLEAFTDLNSDWWDMLPEKSQEQLSRQSGTPGTE